MEQWYKCPRCNQDLIYGTNPCPHCKCSLAWSQQGPTLYLPPSEAPQQKPIQQLSAQPTSEKKPRIIAIVFGIIGGLLLLFVGSCAICLSAATPKSQPTPSSTSPTPYWVEVVRWEGEAIKNTETFNITTTEWRIRWSTRPGKFGDMNFQIFVYSASGNLKGVAANVIGESSDESYFRGSGGYYLTINTGQPYTVIIEQKQ